MRPAKKRSKRFPVSPCMEGIEERLLLTTLYGGDYFIYYNSQGEAVRADLTGDPSDAVELMSLDGGNMIDVVGLMNGDPSNQVLWPDGSHIVDIASNWFLEANASAPDPLDQRGARTEIYAIYVAQCTAATRLTLTTLSATSFTTENWQTSANPYGAADLPVVIRDPDQVVAAPAGSGGVIVGSSFSGFDATSGNPLYTAVGNGDSITSTALGVFPGGDIHPGVQVADGMDLGRILIGGTLAGSLTISGNLNVADVGFLWGDVTVGQNLAAMIMRVGGGASAVITVQGTLGLVDSRGGTLYSGIYVVNDPLVPVPTGMVIELEGTTPGYSFDGTLWDYTNDTAATAQMISGNQGDIVVRGKNNKSGDPLPPDPDWYSMPLMAGQTVTISGADNVGDPLSMGLYDVRGNVLDVLSTSTPSLDFTAPEAGIYYLTVPNAPTTGNYFITITNGNYGALGGVTVTGDFATPSTRNVTVDNGGAIGGILVSGGFVGSASTSQGGDIIAVQMGSTAVGDATGAYISSGANIGRLATTAGVMAGTFMAGAFGNYPNGDIQNISASGDLGVLGTPPIPAIISATGSIGVMEIGGDWNQGRVTINSDGGNGGPARIDMIVVKGNLMAPNIRHGVGDDIGFLDVEGTVYDPWPWGTTPSEAKVITVTDGTSTTITDDGAGQMTIQPASVPVLDSKGNPTHDAQGNPIVTWTMYSYVPFTVYDLSGTRGIGQILTKLTLNGSASFNTSGVFEVGSLDLSGAPSTTTVTFNGSGRTDIYYVNSPQIASFVNNTGGLVSGQFAGATTIKVNGSLGPYAGTTGAWLPGHDAAPGATTGSFAPVVPPPTDEPLFGWFRGTINGLNLTGDVQNILVAGELGDVRSTARIGTIRVNTDGFAYSGQWDGVGGLVWAATGIDAIYVGDGLAASGNVDRARAGIMSSGYIGSVYISGPYYVEDNKSYGLLEGPILAMQDNTILTYGSDGTTVTGQRIVPAIGQIIGTNGAQLTSLVGAGEMDWFSSYKDPTTNSWVYGGGIGTVSFSGTGAEITGAVFGSGYINTVSTSADSNGIYNCTILAAGHSGISTSIGQISAGGPGLSYCEVVAFGGSIGTIRGVGPVADITDNSIRAQTDIKSISARNVINNSIDASGTIGSMSSVGEMSDNTVGTGAVGTVTVGTTFADDHFTIAGKLTSMTVNGSFAYSFLTLQGPAVAYLASLVVNGDITGQITSAGHIGSIISRNGAIGAGIETLPNAWNSNVDLIQVANGYTGTLNVAGTLGRFISNVSLGSNPEDPFVISTQLFVIGGNLTYLKVGNGKNAANLYAGFDVSGNIGTIGVDGTFYGDVSTNGDLGTLTVGGLGGLLDLDHDSVPETRSGSLDVFGQIQRLNIPAGSNLFADLTVGGSLKSLTLKGGSILGNLQSRYGSIDAISVTNGSISGSVTAPKIGTIRVTNGNVTGDITATAGGIGSFTLTGDLTGKLSAGTDIGTLKVTGNVLGGIIRAAGNLNQLTVSKDIKDNLGVSPIISAGWNLKSITVKGNLQNASVMAGYDVGPDGVLDTGDDNPLFGGVHQGDIGNFVVTGTFDGSVVSAGYGPGPDGNMRTVGDNVAAAGVSRILSGRIGGYANSANSAIMAEAYIAPAIYSLAQSAGVSVWVGAPLPLITGPYNPSTDFGPGTPQKSLTVGGLTLTLTGAGTGRYDSATGQLLLDGTTASSKLTLKYAGPGTYPTTITITGNDDSALGSINVPANVPLGSMMVDGLVGTLSAASVNAGSAWNLPGGVNSARLGSLNNVIVNAGPVGSWTMSGGYASGSLTADSIGTFKAGGSVTGKIDVADGQTRSVTISSGNFGGQPDTSFRTYGGIGSFVVSHGQFSGLLSTWGDLTSVTAPLGAMSGRIWSGGSIGSVKFGSMNQGLVAASGSLGTATISGDMLDSYLFAGFDPGDGGPDNPAGSGETPNLQIDAFTNPAWQNAGNADTPAGGTIRLVTIGGDMVGSTISAGVAPGADGYCGTPDDQVAGTGYVYKVAVTGGIFGSSDSSQTFGIFAVNSAPYVTYRHGRIFLGSGNVLVASVPGP